MNLLFNHQGMLRSGCRLLLFLFGVASTGALVGIGWRLVGLPMSVKSGAVDPYPHLLLGIVALLSVLAPLAILFRFVEKRKLSTVGLPLKSHRWLGAVGIGLSIGALNIVTFVLVLVLLGSAEMTWSTTTIADLVGQTIPITLAFIAFAGWEELVLRGYGLQLLAEGLSPFVGACLTGLVFGLLHVSNPHTNVLGVLFTAACGTLLALVVIRTGSLWLAWGYHAGWNITAAVVFGLRVSGFDHPGSIAQLKIDASPLLSGGEYGFEGSVLMGWIEVAVLVAVLIGSAYLPCHAEPREYFTGKRSR